MRGPFGVRCRPRAPPGPGVWSARLRRLRGGFGPPAGPAPSVAAQRAPPSAGLAGGRSGLAPPGPPPRGGFASLCARRVRLRARWGPRSLFSLDRARPVSLFSGKTVKREMATSRVPLTRQICGKWAEMQGSAEKNPGKVVDMRETDVLFRLFGPGPGGLRPPSLPPWGVLPGEVPPSFSLSADSTTALKDRPPGVRLRAALRVLDRRSAWEVSLKRRTALC